MTAKRLEKIEILLHCIDKNLAVTKNNVQRINGSVTKNAKKVNELEKQLAGVTAKIAIFASFFAFVAAIIGSWVWRKIVGL